MNEWRILEINLRSADTNNLFLRIHLNKYICIRSNNKLILIDNSLGYNKL